MRDRHWLAVASVFELFRMLAVACRSSETLARDGTKDTDGPEHGSADDSEPHAPGTASIAIASRPPR